MPRVIYAESDIWGEWGAGNCTSAEPSLLPHPGGMGQGCFCEEGHE